MKRIHAIVVVAVLTVCPAAADAASPTYAKTTTIAGPDGGWDLASVDASSTHLYIARSGGVMRVDLADGRVTPDVVKLQRGHGALALPGGDLVLATSGGESKAILFHGPTGKVVAEIAAGKNPDAVTYDPATRTAWVFNAGSGDATVIDPSSGKVLATVAIGGSLELGAADGRGRLYVNVEDKNDVAVIDTRARKLLKRLPLKGCEGPTGIAYDKAAKLIVSACANGVAKVTTPEGRDVASVPIGPHPDGAAYDEERGLALVPSGGDGQLTVFRLTPKPTVVEHMATAAGARTMAFDEATGASYLPSADYAPPAKAGARPQPLPGTFKIVVVKPVSTR